MLHGEHVDSLKMPEHHLIKFFLLFEHYVQGELLHYLRLINYGMFEQIIQQVADYYKEYSVFDLVVIFNNVINKSSKIDLYQTEIEQFTIDDKSNEIIELLNDKKKIIFSKIIEHISTRIEVIVIFLALLELLKNNKVKIYFINGVT